MSIKKPTAIIWKERVIENIEKMKNKADKSGAELRPHFKTHQNVKIGKWFRSFGVSKITVSSVDMAKFFAKEGWQDILIAFPVNILEIKDIIKLADQIENLELLVESEEVVKFLNSRLNFQIGIRVKIDVGYHRTGMDPSELDSIGKLVKQINKSNKLNFRGLLAHAGHSYGPKTKEEKIEIFTESLKSLTKVKNYLIDQGNPEVKLSYGDTPTCSIVDDFTGIDEIRAGNYTLYDVTQLIFENCEEEDIAIAIACPVVAKHKARNEIILYGGGIHFSKESLKKDNREFYGYLVDHNENGSWNVIDKSNFLSSISQEHGVLKVTDEKYESISVGDLVYILPMHSCLSMNLLKHSIHFI